MVGKGLYFKNIFGFAHQYPALYWQKFVFCLHYHPVISSYRLQLQPILANECPNGLIMAIYLG